MIRARRLEQVSRGRKTFAERIDDVASNFITARARGWSNRKHDIAWLGLVIADHARQCFGGNFRDRAAPTCMDGGKGTRFRITDQNGNAVGSFHSSQNSSRVADNRITVNCVAVFVCSRLGIDQVFNDAHIRAMHLPATCQRPPAG